MMIVGLTGGIGSGKSTVGQMFRDLGIPVYDSDLEAKQLMNSSPALTTSIIDLLGKEAYTDNKLNRAYIAALVFTDPNLLQELNTIVHPAVRAHFLDWAKKQNAPYVIQETALIFENGSQDQYDYTLLVTAPKNVRLERVLLRDNGNKQQILDRMENQMEDNTKEGLSHFSIENTDLDTTKQMVSELHKKLLLLAD